MNGVTIGPRFVEKSHRALSLILLTVLPFIGDACLGRGSVISV